MEVIHRVAEERPGCCLYRILVEYEHGVAIGRVSANGVDAPFRQRVERFLAESQRPRVCEIRGNLSRECGVEGLPGVARPSVQQPPFGKVMLDNDRETHRRGEWGGRFNRPIEW